MPLLPLLEDEDGSRVLMIKPSEETGVLFTY